MREAHHSMHTECCTFTAVLYCALELKEERLGKTLYCRLKILIEIIISIPNFKSQKTGREIKIKGKIFYFIYPFN